MQILTAGFGAVMAELLLNGRLEGRGILRCRDLAAGTFPEVVAFLRELGVGLHREGVAGPVTNRSPAGGAAECVGA